MLCLLFFKSEMDVFFFFFYKTIFHIHYKMWMWIMKLEKKKKQNPTSHLCHYCLLFCCFEKCIIIIFLVSQTNPIITLLFWNPIDYITNLKKMPCNSLYTYSGTDI